MGQVLPCGVCRSARPDGRRLAATSARALQSQRSALGKKVAIIQSNYIPWKGYFDIINDVDEFVLYDEAQYTRRDWRNRNRIKTAHGLIWLTIPVEVRGKYLQKIDEAQIADPSWNRRHWATLIHSYGGAPHFRDYRDLLEQLYLGAECRLLSEINHRFLLAICELLNIRTEITWSTQYRAEGNKTERLISICKQAGAMEYVSGPAASGYIDEALFAREGIALRYADYSGYPEYHQLFPPFEHRVSVIDLILNEGPAASGFMKSFGSRTTGARTDAGSDEGRVAI
jgi:hypothetical protein